MNSRDDNVSPENTLGANEYRRCVSVWLAKQAEQEESLHSGRIEGKVRSIIIHKKTPIYTNNIHNDDDRIE